MKSKFTRWMTASALLLGSSIFASADSCDWDCMDNWYLEAQGGALWHRDTVTQDSKILGAGNDSTFEHKVGYTGGFEFGFMPDDCWHLGIGVDFRRNDNDILKNASLVADGGKIRDKGYIQHISAMLNAYYDWWFADCMSLSLGGGVGAAHTRLYGENHNLTGGGIKQSIADHDINFAWQLKAKLAYHFTESWALVLGYTFFNTLKPSLRTVPVGVTGSKSYKLHKSPYTNDITLGLRLTF